MSIILIFRACIAIAVCFILSAFAIAAKAVYTLVKDRIPTKVWKRSNDSDLKPYLHKIDVLGVITDMTNWSKMKRSILIGSLSGAHELFSPNSFYETLNKKVTFSLSCLADKFRG